jgi:TonB family protein
MKPLLLSILTFFCFAKPVYAQNEQTKKQPGSSTTKEKVITKDVTLTRTEIDNTPDEIKKFDDYVAAHINSSIHMRGNVVVSFTNEADGTITHIKIVKSLNPVADKEAIRLLRSYRHWEPNLVDGKPEKSVITIPILFGKRRS